MGKRDKKQDKELAVAWTLVIAVALVLGTTILILSAQNTRLATENRVLNVLIKQCDQHWNGP